MVYVVRRGETMKRVIHPACSFLPETPGSLPIVRSSRSLSLFLSFAFIHNTIGTHTHTHTSDRCDPDQYNSIDNKPVSFILLPLLSTLSFTHMENPTSPSLFAASSPISALRVGSGFFFYLLFFFGQLPKTLCSHPSHLPPTRPSSLSLLLNASKDYGWLNTLSMDSPHLHPLNPYLLISFLLFLFLSPVTRLHMRANINPSDLSCHPHHARAVLLISKFFRVIFTRFFIPFTMTGQVDVHLIDKYHSNKITRIHSQHLPSSLPLLLPLSCNVQVERKFRTVDGWLNIIFPIDFFSILLEEREFDYY